MNRPALDVVFDLDGTLLDSVGHCTLILNDMLADRGSARVLTAFETRPHITMGGRKMVQALLAQECGDPDIEIADFRARYEALPTPESSLFPDVRQTLAALLKDGFRLSVCSNKTQPLCEKVLTDLGLADAFSAIVGSVPGTPLKPDPAMFDLLMGLVGGKRSRSCYVGDAEVDEQLATQIGAPFVFLTYGYAEASYVCNTPFQARSFAEAPAQIRLAMQMLCVGAAG